MFDSCTSRDWNAQPRHRLAGFFHVLLTLSLAVAGLTAGIAVPGMSRTVHAASLRPHLLGLPRSLLPRMATVRSTPVNANVAAASSGLHSTDLSALGRTGSYLQTVRWAIAGKRPRPMTLKYVASIFDSVQGAATAYADARASLWELGRPRRLPGFRGSAFTISERGGHVDIATAGYVGIAEWEMSLVYPMSLDKRSRAAVLATMGHMAGAAARLIAHRVPVESLIPDNALIPVAEAPWGTGPVAKSPSLMVLGASDAAPGDTILPGVMRQAPPPLAVHTFNHASLEPTGSMTPFVRLLAAANGGEIYDGAALFSSVAEAIRIFDSMKAANDAQSWLHSQDLHPALSTLKWLAAADAVQSWQSRDSTLLLVRYSNVIMVFTGTGQPAVNLLLLADRMGATVPSPLHAFGTTIVDVTATPVHLVGLNWYGAEQQDFVVGGLDYRPYRDILQTIHSLGYNSIRLPFSNQLVEQNPVVTAHLQANPDLQGMHALDILDRIIAYAGALGLSVILDDHRSDAGWSSQQDGLWYTPAYPDTAFASDWQFMARRYAVNDVVVGADLRNEPHGSATWGDGNATTDWRAAAERAGNAVLAQNPNLLVIVEGVQFVGKSPSYWWGGNLMGVATAPVNLNFADGSSAHSRLVYSAHEYGQDNCGIGCPWFNSTTTYDSLSQLWDQYWGYIAEDPSKPYAAPVWVGEFGTCNYQADCVSSIVPGSQGQWFTSLIRYLGVHHLSWCYWSANGTQSTAPTRTYGELDWYGLLGKNWLTPGPWLHDALRGIQIENGPPG